MFGLYAALNMKGLTDELTSIKTIIMTYGTKLSQHDSRSTRETILKYCRLLPFSKSNSKEIETILSFIDERDVNGLRIHMGNKLITSNVSEQVAKYLEHYGYEVKEDISVSMVSFEQMPLDALGMLDVINPEIIKWAENHELLV